MLAADRRYVFDVSAPGTALRNFTSGWYIAQLCGANGKPRVFFSMSAASDVRVTATGALDSLAPNNFFSEGMPPALEGLLVPTPERAAEIAHLATGQRIASLPALFVGTEESLYAFSGIHALLGLSLAAPGLDRDSLPDIGFDPIEWQSVQIRHGLPAAVEPFTLVR